MAMVFSAWRDDGLRRPRGWGAAHEALNQLRLANGDASVLRRWKRLNQNLSRKVFDQILEQQDVHSALTVYTAFDDVPWLRDKTSDVAALLYKSGMQKQADSLLLSYRQQRVTAADRLKLGCSLLKSYGRHGLWDKVRDEFDGAVEASPSQVFTTLLQVQAENRDPVEAEVTLRKMQAKNLKPTLGSYKTLVFSYGKCGLLLDMERVFEEMKQQAGFRLDAVTCTMMLVAYGTHRKHEEMLQVVAMMQASGIQACIRSWNALGNACPALLPALESGTSYEALELKLAGMGSGELDVVRAMMLLSLPPGTVAWSGGSWKLDMHSMSVGTAYVALHCWFRDAKARLADVPAEVEIVTGWGKHSTVEGTSQVKNAVTCFLRNSQSPFRVDRLNKGRLICKGLRLKEWLA